MQEINHEYYVSCEVAKLLKEAGFDWECNGIFISEDGNQYAFIKIDAACDSNNSKYNQYNISAPTLDVAQRWLRDVKSIAVYVCPSYEPNKFVTANVVERWIMKWQVVALHYDIESDEINLGDVDEEMFDTYEEALEAGIKKVLEMILEL